MTRAEVLYPDRQRCRNCRRYFGATVIDGQWCSYHCAGKDAPSIDRNDWPRCHYWQGMGPRVAKTPYSSEREALEARGGDATAYRCTYCWRWHRASVRAAKGRGRDHVLPLDTTSTVQEQP